MTNRLKAAAINAAMTFILVFVIVTALTGCAVDQPKPEVVVSHEFTVAPAAVATACVKEEDVPVYPELVRVDVDKGTHKQVDAANEANLVAFKLYADAAKPILQRCTKGGIK